jgi:L-fuconolactonase
MREPSVIDAHVHFWDPERMRYPWLDTRPDLRRAFRPEDIRSGPVQIEAMVVVEADRERSQSLAEVEWAVSLSSPSRPVLGVVAAVELESPTASVELELLSRRPEVKGVRRLLQDLPPGFCLEPAFVSGVESLAQWDLVFDLCLRQHQLVEATALVTQCPDVIFVLDHLGKPSVQPSPERSWLTDIERLAALPNARCKLSGLTTEVLDPPRVAGPGGIFRPYLEHALQSFGPDRCMFGSDWPVASLNVTYDGWVDHVLAALTAFPATDTEQVLRRTAAEVYRLAAPRRPSDWSESDEANLPPRPEREPGGETAWH